MFSRKFRQHGNAQAGTFLRVFKIGDIVDIVANASQQKGMPHKCAYGYEREKRKKLD